jgi:hypothetical protein
VDAPGFITGEPMAMLGEKPAPCRRRVTIEAGLRPIG